MPDPGDYRIVRRPRRRTIALVVRRDGRLEVLAPPGVPEREIAGFVQQKQPWISRKQQQCLERAEAHPPRRFVDGERFMLRGEAITLSLVTGPRRIECEGNTLHVRLRDTGPDSVRKVLERWYARQAEAELKLRMPALSERAGVAPATIGVKGYRSRWGTCHPDGRIYLNWRLIKAPPAVFDHVILHELCHLIHRNHSLAFHRLLASLDANYAEADRWLKQHGANLIW